MMKASIQESLTIVIVSFNSGKLILEALGEFIASSVCRIIIVDNASKDDSQSMLRGSFPEVTVIGLPVNIGYGRAANIGLKLVDTDYGLLINPDVLLTKNNLKKVFANVLVSDKKAAIFSPALKKESFVNQGNICVEYLIGAFLLFNMKALQEVGYFDENIFLYYEEKDLELRLIKSGYKLILQSDIYVEHIGAASSGKDDKVYFLRNWHVAWSNLYYLDKHNLTVIKVSMLILAIKYGFKSIINTGRKKIKYKARFKGVLAYIRGDKAFCEKGFGRYAEDV